ncbi:MAG: hypothetical protein ACK2VD_17350 [Anaerolineae bacterium]|jgi:hypothetical protein
MSFIQTIPPEEATGAVRELYDRGGPVWQNLTLRPEAGLALHALIQALRATMAPRRFEMVYFLSASRNGCSA